MWPIGQYGDMNAQDLKSEMERYCEKRGILPSTLGLLAVGSSRFFERFCRRHDQLARDEHRVRAYMAANPPKDNEQAAS